MSAGRMKPADCALSMGGAGLREGRDDGEASASLGGIELETLPLLGGNWTGVGESEGVGPGATERTAEALMDSGGGTWAG